jgi:hypothetical protein
LEDLKKIIGMEMRKETMENRRQVAIRGGSQPNVPPSSTTLTLFCGGIGLASRKPVNTRSSPTDLIRSDALGATVKFQSSRRYVYRCPHSRSLDWHPVQSDPARLGHITKKSAQRARRLTIPLILKVLTKCSTSFEVIITVIVMATSLEII